MYVSTILSAKGTQVVTVEPERSLEEVSKILTDHGIGTVVVTDKVGGTIGILSERDIVRAVADDGATALLAPVSNYMTTQVRTTVQEEPIRSIMEQMTEGRFRHIPVIKDDRLVGIISIGDVVKLRLAEMEAEANALRDYIASA